jgi:Lrp/AsnC family leucine-responsive transcriptional regulator
MTKIDLKDRKILYELDINCRQSNYKIGKKVGLKRDVVAYRIKRMQEEGIITHFWTVIDTFKLGYNVFRVYLNFQDISMEEKKLLVKDFIDYRNSWAVTSIAGPIDFSAVIWVDNIFEFNNFLDKILDKFGKYISKKIISVYVQADEYEKSYLLPYDIEKTERVKFTINCGEKKADIDELDYKIIDNLSLNARIPLIDLASKLNTSSQTINYRLQKLIKSGVIKGFRVGIDISKLDLQYFDVRIILTDHSYRKKIIRYLQNKTFFKCINTAFGYTDLELEFILKNLDKLIEIMDDLNEKFPHVIRNYHYLKIRERYKERWLPKIY